MRRALREANRISAAELARPLGVTRQTVSKWECGKRTPRGELLAAYVAVLDELAASLREAS
jgi:transcriptional regulator with XRE-family HTH domain